MKPHNSDFLDKVFALMAEKRLTYREACSELGRRGAAVRRANKRLSAWHPRSLKFWIRKNIPR